MNLLNYLLEGYINVNNIDIICLLETFLDSSIRIDDNRLSIPGYSMMTVDHPNNTKRGGVCLYYKEHLPIIRRDDISNLKECLGTEITVRNERCFLTCLCRSPSQNREQFQSFNGKCSKWYSFDTSDNIRKNLIPLDRLRVIVKLLTSQPILQIIHTLLLTLLLHLILAY